MVEFQSLEMFNHLIQPIWVFDFIEERNRWANVAGLDLWCSPNVKEFCSRDRTQGRSASTNAKLKQAQSEIERGGHIALHWTLYPRGQARAIHITVTGIQLQPDGHKCMLFHGIPVETESLEKQSLRGVEMLRHLPIAVCQFNLSGNAMFENQSSLLPAPNETDQDNHNDSESFECHQPTFLDHGGGNFDKKTSMVRQEAPPTHCPALQSTLPSSDGRNPTCATETRKTDQQQLPKNTNVGNDFLRRFVDEKVATEAFDAILKAKPDSVIQLEAELQATVQSERKLWSGVSLRKATDPITGEQVILYDAMDKSDARRAQAERAASVQKSEFLAIMAHEIRSPLHQVIGFVDLLEQTQPLSKEQQDYVKLCQDSSQALMTVISDVLDYSKLESGELKVETIPFEPLNVVEGSLAAVRNHCQEKQLSLTLDWSSEIPFRLIGDPNRVRQVLLNFLSNALKCTKQGGIHVTGILLKQGDLELEHGGSDEMVGCNWAKVIVSDTGIGICKSNQQMIFEKYTQASASVTRTHGGTGLGLSICQLLIRSMKGRIGVHSVLGKGSDFWFMLPVRESMPHRSSPTGISSPSDTSAKLNILVAEDNLINQKLISRMLTRLGHTSRIVENGKVAIIELESNYCYDLVLMDIQMPVMDGVEATRRLRTMGYKELPILALTASVKQHDYRELGFTEWLSKPTPLKELKEKLLRSIHGT